ncbi:MAG: SDR family oxidoreductase [Euryarchaeota archaeon]|nr:SDR family oxidoreductase [Euryarchaeota archaeon]
MKVAITGVSGYVGSRLLSLLESEPRVEEIVGIDLRSPGSRPAKLKFYAEDIRSPRLRQILGDHRPDVLVHLAFIVNPIHNEREMHDIDVNGSRNVLQAALDAGTRKLIVASSATAYGAHPDNPEGLTEEDPLRGNPEFTYSHHKALVERICADLQRRHPGTLWTLLRPCIIVGPHQKNYLLDSILPPKRYYMVRGRAPRFQFVHEDDVARAYHQAILEDRPGPWNLAGDGGLTMPEMSRITGIPTRSAPYAMGRLGLTLAWRLRLIGAPPGVLDFICYPWTLDNRRIKNEWGFKFTHDSEGAYRNLVESRRKNRD